MCVFFFFFFKWGRSAIIGIIIAFVVLFPLATSWLRSIEFELKNLSNLKDCVFSPCSPLFHVAEFRNYFCSKNFEAVITSIHFVSF